MIKKAKFYIIMMVIILVALVIYFTRIYLQNKNFSRIKPHVGTITEAIYGLGKVRSNHRFEVKLGILSTIKKIYVHEGDFIEKKQRLVDLDSGVTIFSPISGTVTLVAADEGETVLPQIPFIRVEDLQDRYLELSLEQDGILRIRKGQNALVSFEALRGEVLSGTVVALYPKDDEFIAHIEINSLRENILPGMTADVSVEVGKIHGLLIPIKAVKNGFVSLRRNNRIEKVKIEIGLSDNLSVEVKDDSIKESDEVLVPKEED